MKMLHRVVITGMGVYSCIGNNKEEVLQSLFDGRSGIGIAPERKAIGYRSALCGILKKPDLKGLLDRRQRLCLSEHGQYAYLATVEALKQAGMDNEYLLNNEVGILYGNDSSAEAVITGIDVIREKKNTVMVGSGNIFQSMNSTITMNLSTIFNLRGINFTVSGACASGSHAIGMAYLLIKQGLQERVICGGAEELQAGVHCDQHVQGSGEQELEAPGPELGGVRGLRYGEQPCDRGGREVRRRDEEGYLRRDELLPASAGHSADALLGERGQGRRLGAVLRSVGHGQDDAVSGPEAIPDRRR